MHMQTILGAGGDIGSHLAKALTNHTGQIRLVARHPKAVNPGDDLFPADLLQPDAVRRAVAGSEVTYLTVGLPYDVRVWEKQWPVIMNNVIDACLAAGSRLVFFDNIYMYDRSATPHLREDSAVNPPSRKGLVRAHIAGLLQKEMTEKGLPAVIARSADFYGPGARNGILNVLVTDPFKKGSTANWQADVNRLHSFTYIPDAARATAILGNTPDAYNQVWHLPTSAERWTGKKFIETAAELAHVRNRYRVLKPWMLSLFGLFSRQMHELVEMQYQNQQDYFFDSEKFNRHFSFTPTDYTEGIRQTLAHMP